MGGPTNLDYNDFLRGLEELLQVHANSFQGTEVLGELSCWDSLAIVEFMAFADERYSTTLAPKAITSCSTIRDLFLLLQSTANEL